jgi:16S rRNA (adenine1518-N6/adenine1519-N6)-dimethyltransferase
LGHHPVVQPETLSPKALLARHGLRAKKSFGQNFLVDVRIAQRLADLALGEPGEAGQSAAGGDRTGTGDAGGVIEIGAGLGALTRPLLARAAQVAAIERDRDLIPVLSELFAEQVAAGKLVLLEADAQSLDFVEVFAGLPRPHSVAGNLPYQLTGSLLRKLSTMARSIVRALVLVQLEVADRLVAAPGSDAYGALSIFIQAQFVPTRAFIVRRGAFYPEPGVDSAAVLLTSRTEPLAEETEAFRTLVHGAFQQRRKKLRNAWQGVLGRSDVDLRAAAERAGIDLNLRGETLDVAAFARMAAEVVQ